MIINSPSFSGSITQASSAYANLSGSFTGSFTGSFKGSIDVQQATFENLVITRTIKVGTYSTDLQIITGSLLLSGSENIYGKVFVSGATQITGGLDVAGGNISQNGVNLLDTALAYSIALG
jgi:phage baseplate assembly protein gpV